MGFFLPLHSFTASVPCGSNLSISPATLGGVRVQGQAGCLLLYSLGCYWELLGLAHSRVGTWADRCQHWHTHSAESDSDPGEVEGIPVLSECRPIITKAQPHNRCPAQVLRSRGGCVFVFPKETTRSYLLSRDSQPRRQITCDTPASQSPSKPLK